MNDTAKAWTPIVAIVALTFLALSTGGCHVDVDELKYVLAAIAGLGGWGLLRLGNRR